MWGGQSRCSTCSSRTLYSVCQHRGSNPHLHDSQPHKACRDGSSPCLSAQSPGACLVVKDSKFNCSYIRNRALPGFMADRASAQYQRDQQAQISGRADCLCRPSACASAEFISFVLTEVDPSYLQLLMFQSVSEGSAELWNVSVY